MIFQAFLEHNQPPYPAISVLKGMYAFKRRMKGNNVKTF